MAHVYEPKEVLVALCGHTKQPGEPDHPDSKSEVGACGLCVAIALSGIVVDAAIEMGKRA